MFAGETPLIRLGSAESDVSQPPQNSGAMPKLSLTQHVYFKNHGPVSIQITGSLHLSLAPALRWRRRERSPPRRCRSVRRCGIATLRRTHIFQRLNPYIDTRAPPDACQQYLAILLATSKIRIRQLMRIIMDLNVSVSLTCEESDHDFNREEQACPAHHAHLAAGLRWPGRRSNRRTFRDCISFQRAGATALPDSKAPAGSVTGRGKYALTL